MKRLVWLTDIHLNFLNRQQVDAFGERVDASGADAVLISGDIGEAPTVGMLLGRLKEGLSCPVYFVLGNHDFYRGSIAEVRTEIADLSNRKSELCWLSAGHLIQLTEKTGMIGHDSWADGRLGDYWRSRVQLNDYILISDFIGLDAARRLHKAQRHGPCKFGNGSVSDIELEVPARFG